MTENRGYVYAFATIERGRTVWQLVIQDCPFCGRQHVHGGGDFTDDPRRYYSSRVPHCYFGDVSMYVLTPDAVLNGLPAPAPGAEVIA